MKENIKEHNPNWPKIPDYSHRILIICWSGSRKNSLFNLTSQQTDTDKIYLYAKDPCKAKYQFLINESKNTGLKHFSEFFLLNTQIIWIIFVKNTEEYNPDKTYIYIYI